MAQYPQGIFQSLQWLMKKVKILALQKQPVYNVGTIATGTTYTIPGRGVYIITETAGTGKLQFPNPTLMQGQTIILQTTSIVTFNSVYAPINGSSIALTQADALSIYTLISNGVNWIVTAQA